MQLINLMKNDLEVVVEKEYSSIKNIKRFLIERGAKKAMMTGSGSAVFGIFNDKNSLIIAFREAKKQFKSYNIFNCKTIGA